MSNPRVQEFQENEVFERDEDFQSISMDKSYFQNDISFGHGRFLNRSIFLHGIKALFQNRSRLKEIQEQNKESQDFRQRLEVKDIPSLKEEESMEQYADVLNEELQGIIREDGSKEITAHQLMKALVFQFKWDMIVDILFFWSQSACRIGFSVMFFILLNELLALEAMESSARDFTKAYLLSFFSGLLWLVAQNCAHNGCFDAMLIGTKIRSALIGIIFKKLTKISLYTAKSQELGKIINMFANDFNVIELKCPWFFAASPTPIVVIGSIVLLITRLGWFGIICPAIIIVFIPLQILVSRLNGGILKNVNIFKDDRVKMCSEIIEGIKFIKLYGWEMAFKKIINGLRKQQIDNFTKFAGVKSVERALGNCITLWSGLVCFLVMHFTGQGENLNIATIFSTLQILVTLRLALFYFGFGNGYYFQVLVILERYAEILNIKNERMIRIDEQTKQPIPRRRPVRNQDLGTAQRLEIIQEDDASQQMDVQIGQIKFKNFNGYWKSKDFQVPTLKNIGLEINKGDFCGITGRVGSGKSALLGVMFEEIPYYSGHFAKEGIISYVEQEPVLFSATVKENILFSREFDQERYSNALRDSCLVADLQLLENGEDTMVGEKGVTLSGGQKARMALARAIYCDADIYLFDDPISAVDSKVARQLYERVMIKLRKKKKTVVLVTHQVSYLFQCDKVLIMEDGKIVHQGSPQNLREELRSFQLSEEPQEEEAEQMSDGDEVDGSRENFLNFLNPVRRRQISEHHTVISTEKSNQQRVGPANMEEDVQVTCGTYKNYLTLSKTNYVLFPFTILVFLLSETINVFYFRFLADYGSIYDGVHEIFGSNDRFYFGILGLLLFNHFIVFIIKYIMLQMALLLSNRKLHKVMISGLVRSPCSYFDVTPAGRLTNKFSNDLGILDNLVGWTALDALEGTIYIVASMVSIFVIDLFFMIPGLINLLGLGLLLLFCNQIIIHTRKLDLRMKDPVFSTVDEVISGLTQIRIFNRRKSMLQEFTKIVNDSYRATMNFWYTTRVFGVYSSYISMAVLIIGFVLGIRNIEAGSASTSAGLYGVTVVFLLQINDNVQWSIRQVNFLESLMVSTERSFIVKNLKPEKQLRNDYDRVHQINHLIVYKGSKSTIRSNISNQAASEWPRRAIIRIKNFSLRYRPELPLVLKKISFTIQEGEKFGIVGRTGAGKSSIIQALFRIVEPEEGSIYEIDNLDALKLGLHTLRHRISVIPQVPFLFKGSIKTNLDPFGKYKEEEQTLWNALQDSGLKKAVEDLPQKLQTNISNIAEVFSVGQKQLLCLARALLRNNKFLILDEATSNVDMETDKFIQECIERKFVGTTVITIAHRLNTIANYDKVMVMKRGRIEEIGTPHELIQQNGLFAQMVDHTGENAQNIRNTARRCFERRRSSNIH